MGSPGGKRGKNEGKKRVEGVAQEEKEKEKERKGSDGG